MAKNLPNHGAVLGVITTAIGLVDVTDCFSAKPVIKNLGNKGSFTQFP